MAERIFRIFVSSPDDVDAERRRVDRVAERLNGEFAGRVRLVTIRWETAFYTADKSFQDQISPSVDCDLVVGIFWSRLGSELPPHFPLAPDGMPWPSGSAYEILSAIEWRRKGEPLPDVYIFRKTSAVPLSAADTEARSRALAQLDRLDGFWKRWFQSDTGHFLAAFQSFETPDTFEAQLEPLLRGWILKHAAIDASVIWPIVTKGSPFRGLESFDASHASVFFGRDREVAHGIDAWKAAADRGTALLVVVGASGSGKSSLVRAGLVPRLTVPGVVSGVDFFRVAIMRPSDGGSPFRSLAQRLFEHSVLPELGDGDAATPSALEAQLRHADETALHPLLRALVRAEATLATAEAFQKPARGELVLVIDQFEELFALTEEEEAHFARLIVLLARSGRVRVALTVRADHYDRLLANDILRAAKEVGATLDVAPPGTGDLSAIVRRPAEAAGLVFERDPETGAGVDDLILEAASPPMLPLVQFTLHHLFEERLTRQAAGGDETVLTLDAYRALGGIDGAINTEAERALARVGDAEREALPKLLRKMVRLTEGKGEGAASTGGRDASVQSVAHADAVCDAPTAALVAELIAGRILTSEDDEAGPRLRPAHERILSAWRRAAAIVSESREFLRRRGDVERQFARWRAAGELSDLLIPPGLALAEAGALLKARDELDEPLAAFVDASLAAEAARQQAERDRSMRRQRIMAVAAAVMATIAGIAVWQTYVAHQARDDALHAEAAMKDALSAEQMAKGKLTTALEESQISLAKYFGVHAPVVFATNPEGVLMALQAATSGLEPERIPREAIEAAANAVNGEYGSAMFPADRELVRGPLDRSLTRQILTAPDGSRAAVIRPEAFEIYRLPDLALLCEGRPSANGGGEDVTQEVGNDLRIYEIAWSHDGRRLATSLFNGRLSSWSGDLCEETPLSSHGVSRIQWSSDDRRLLVRSFVGVSILDSAGGNVLLSRPRPTGDWEWVVSTEWNRDESRVLVADEKSIKILDGSDLRAVEQISLPEGARTKAAHWSSNESTLDVLPIFLPVISLVRR